MDEGDEGDDDSNDREPPLSLYSPHPSSAAEEEEGTSIDSNPSTSSSGLKHL